MSTATSFKHHRPFPFCPTADLSAYSFSPFDPHGSDPSGQPGLRNAMRFFWNLERIKFIPSGAYLELGEDFFALYPNTAQFPKPEEVEGSLLESYAAWGAMLGGDEATSTSDAIPPRERVCWPPVGYEGNEQLVAYVAMIYIPDTGPRNMDMEIRLYVDFRDGEWGIAYDFAFCLSGNGGEGRLGIIKSPLNSTSTTGYTLVDSGVINFLGAGLDWQGYFNTARIADMTSAPRLNDADVDSEFFTY